MSWAARPLASLKSNLHHHIPIPSRFPSLHGKITPEGPVAHTDGMGGPAQMEALPLPSRSRIWASS